MAEAVEGKPLDRVLAELRRRGILLFSDPALPSVVSIVTGSPAHGSWWSLPAGNSIYLVGEALESHPEVVVVPLVLRKGTLVHRRLWRDLLSVGVGKERWQMAGLLPAGRTLLSEVEEQEELRVDNAPLLRLSAKRSIGDVARDLERRLLVVGRSMHSESGRHVKVLTSWERWTHDRGVQRRGLNSAEGRQHLEFAVHDLMSEHPRRGLLPWFTAV